MKKKNKSKGHFVNVLRQLAHEIREFGLGQFDAEDGEIAFILSKAANLIDDYAPDELP
jgi:hypothetical protein